MNSYRLWTVLALLYVLAFMLKQEECVIPFFNGHLADLLCMPLVLATAVSLIRRLPQKGNTLLDAEMIFAAFLYMAIIFEIVLPSLSVRFTADPLDVIMLAAGAVFFYRYQSLMCPSLQEGPYFF